MQREALRLNMKLFAWPSQKAVISKLRPIEKTIVSKQSHPPQESHASSNPDTHYQGKFLNAIRDGGIWLS